MIPALTAAIQVPPNLRASDKEIVYAGKQHFLRTDSCFSLCLLRHKLSNLALKSLKPKECLGIISVDV